MTKVMVDFERLLTVFGNCLEILQITKLKAFKIPQFNLYILGN